MINHYFQSGIPGGRASEQFLMEDLIIECLQIYGFEVYYLPRKAFNKDKIFTEDALSRFNYYFLLEMYLKNVEGFEGEGELLSKFGLEIRDTATFMVSRRRWDLVVAKEGKTVLLNRPAEGDIIYFPLTNAYFEIKKVETQTPFFQVGKLYTFDLVCELVQYSHEMFNTGNSEIDGIEQNSTDLSSYELVLENGFNIMLEYETPSTIILEEYRLEDIDVLSQNKEFENNSDILDFSERNPFGEVLG